MDIFLALAFLFFIGSVGGFVIELFYRRFLSRANPERKWINPGFCAGPYLPLYGSGLCLLYLIASLEKFELIEHPVWSKLVLFVVMALCMTVIEFIAGLASLKLFKVRLWDYSGEWGNLLGIICPKFSFFWSVLSAAYYFLVHPHILAALSWLSQNLAFSFVIGAFFGVFTVDVVHSSGIVLKLRRFAEENGIIVRYEHLKAAIRSAREKQKQKISFLLPFKLEKPLGEYLKEHLESFEERFKKK